MIARRSRTGRSPGGSALAPGMLATYARGGCLLALLAVFLRGGAPWLLATLFVLAALLDLADGALARWSGTTSRRGARWDVELDAAAVLLAVVLLVALGKLPLFALAAGLARYLYLAALALARRAGHAVRPLDATPRRRLVAGLHTGFLAACFFPILPAGWSRLAAFVFCGALLFFFARDLAYTLGAGVPRPPFLPPLAATFARALLAAAAVAAPWSITASPALLAVAAVGVLCVFAGCFTRCGAVALALLATLVLDTTQPLGTLLSVAWLDLCAVVLLGGGAYALDHGAEDRWLLREAVGESAAAAG